MACIFLVISFIHSFFYTVNIFQKDLFQTLEHPMLKYVNLKIRMQKLLMGPWDPGSKWRHPNAGTQVPGPELSGLECLGPKYWDPPSRDPNEGTQILDVNMVTNVYVSTKLTVGTLEHSFKSIDEGREIRSID